MKSNRQLVGVVTLLMFLCFAATLNAASVTVTVDANSYIRSIPETMFSTNTQTWDGLQNGGNDNFNALMAASGRRYVRWPGGSWGDAYLWSNMENNEVSTWIVSYDESMYWINKTSSILQPIVNLKGWWIDSNHLPEGITAAANWVADQSSRIPTARYWEIGNESYGSWEAGYDANMNGTWYGNRFADLYLAMKAVNDQIKIGAVAREWDSDYSQWTRKELLAAYAKGVVPDFLIIHEYPRSNQGASYNTTLLGSDIDAIGAASSNYTTSMNNIISSAIGSQYVGKIKFWMTEWDAGGISGTYPRWTAYVNLMFQSQYILEMAKYGWEGSNPWSQNEYHINEANYPNFYVYPKWYVSPMLSYYFGRDMVAASSTVTRVRAYASRDEANNLTIFLVNNYTSTDYTATINISNFTADTNGQRWLIEPAGSMIPGGVNSQDDDDININGVIHPNPLTIASLSGVPLATGNSFVVNLPASRMLLIKIPPATPTAQLPYGGTPSSIPGTIEAENYDTGGKFVAYYDTNSGNSGGQYRSDDVDIETCSEGGYDVNGIYVGEWLEYTVNVDSSGIYKIQARVASADSNGALRIYFDSKDMTGPITFPATGGSQTFATVDINNIFLSKGQYTMRLLMDANGWSINWISFSKIGGGTGKALREWWTGISGSAVSNLTSNINYPYNPTGRELARSFEGPTNWVNSSGTSMDNYGTHIRGYLHPIADGNYTFWIASDDTGELWLSTDTDPCHASKIAYLTSYVNPYKWDKNTTQKSSSIALLAGQDYYIEALHKESTGGDSVAVAWQGPGIIRQAITGPYLTPYPIGFIDFANLGRQWYQTGCASGNAWCSGADLDHSGSVTIDDLMQFVETWWLYGAE